MNFTLAQEDSFLLGSKAAVEELAQKEDARILVFSDSHCSSSAVSFILHKSAKECDALVFCGDGAGDLIDAFSNPSLKDFIPPVVALVQGNNDSSLYPVKNPAVGNDSSKPFFVQLEIPQKIEFIAAGHKVAVLHGHRHSLYSGASALKKEASSSKAALLLYGHSHVPSCIYCGTSLLLNPGSCSKPRGKNGASYAVVKLSKKSDNIDYTFFEISYPEPKPFIP